MQDKHLTIKIKKGNHLPYYAADDDMAPALMVLRRHFYCRFAFHHRRRHDTCIYSAASALAYYVAVVGDVADADVANAAVAVVVVVAYYADEVVAPAGVAAVAEDVAEVAGSDHCYLLFADLHLHCLVPSSSLPHPHSNYTNNNY